MWLLGYVEMGAKQGRQKLIENAQTHCRGKNKMVKHSVMQLFNFIILIDVEIIGLISLICEKYFLHISFITPQPIRAVGVLFSPMLSGWAGGQREIVCPGCISERCRCRRFILGLTLI